MTEQNTGSAGPENINPIHKQCLQIYNEFCQKSFQAKGKIDKQESEAMTKLIIYLRESSKEQPASEQAIIGNWAYILDNYDHWDKYRQQDKIKISEIESNIVNIRNSISKNLKKKTPAQKLGLHEAKDFKLSEWKN